MAIPGFIFGGNTGETPQSLEQKRRIAESITGGLFSHAPRNVGEGLNAIGQALIARSMLNEANQGDKTGQSLATASWNPLLASLGGQQFPNAPGAGADTSAPTGNSPAAQNADYPSERVAQAFGDQPGNGDVETYIRQAAAARGIDPNVAVQVAKSEGGLKDPFRHGEGPAPRSQASGLGNTENSYGPLQLYISGNGAGLGDRALAAGIDPRKDWKGGVDFALDEVRKKGWGQWYGAKSQGITGMMGVGSQPPAAQAVNALAQGAPVQVASNDPAAGVAQQPPALPAPRTVQDMPVASAPQQMAQSAPANLPAEAGGSGGAFQAGQGPSVQMLMQAYGNPWLSDSQRAAVGLLLKQQMENQQQANDPMRALDMEYKKAQIGALQNPSPKMTADMQEYNFAKSQGFGGSFMDFMLAQKKAGATNISDIGNTKGETAYDQTLGKNLADKTVGILDAGNAASGKIATLQAMKNALANVYQGAGGESAQSLRRVAQSLGFDVSNVGDGDLAQSLSNQMALQMRNPSGGAGMPGAMSDKDREFLQNIVPGLSKTPQGNAQLIDYMTRIEQRNQDVAKQAADYMNAHNNRLDQNFFADLAKWSAANPLFPQQSQGGGAGNGGGTTTNGLKWSIVP